MSRSEHSAALSSRVREMTADDHQKAETASFITELMRGDRSTRDYALLVSQYFYIYNALDQAAAQLRNETKLPGLIELLDPRLDRRAAISQDLGSLLPEVELSPEPVQLCATKEYVERIHHVATDTARFTAHHYLRYLGDLSGGLAIARLVKRHYDVADDQLNMYTFSSIDKPKLYKDAYRDQLDNLGLTIQQQEEFIAEANLGFGLNRKMFEELATYTGAQTPVHI